MNLKGPRKAASFRSKAAPEGAAFCSFLVKSYRDNLSGVDLFARPGIDAPRAPDPVVEDLLFVGCSRGRHCLDKRTGSCTRQTELGNATADSLMRLFLPMHQPVAHGADGASDVDHRNRPFQLVMAGLVKKIAETDNAHRFPDKIRRQPR